MRTQPLGEGAWILRDLPVSPARVCAILNGADARIAEAVPSYETVGVYYDPLQPLAAEEIEALLAGAEETPELESSKHIIPVCYSMGEDLGLVAEGLGVSASRVIEMHTGPEYVCYAIGFCPGFPYLGYLESELAGIPRRSAPRNRVEPGSVAITGRQTGIYPVPRPGGWAILGRTPLELVDVEERYFPISVGDTVRFVAIDRAEFTARLGERL